MSVRSAIAISCALLLISLGSDAAVFRWVDNHGLTHFSDSPPPPGVKDRGQKLAAPPPPAVPPEQAVKHLQEMNKRFDTLRKKEQKQQQQDLKQAQQKARNESNCQAARANLDHLNNRARRRMVDSSGNVIVLTEQERQRQIAQAQAQIDKFCQ